MKDRDEKTAELTKALCREIDKYYPQKLEQEVSEDEQHIVFSALACSVAGVFRMASPDFDTSKEIVKRFCDCLEGLLEEMYTKEVTQEILKLRRQNEK